MPNLSNDGYWKRQLILISENGGVFFYLMGSILLVFSILLAFFQGFKIVESYDWSTYVLNVISSLLFGAPALINRYVEGKPLSEMSLEELKGYVSRTNPSDWECIIRGEDYEYFLRRHIGLRIKHQSTLRENFIEPWVTFADRTASSEQYSVYFDNNEIFNFVLVAVDGWRCLLPLPQRGHDASPAVTPEQDHLARIVVGGYYNMASRYLDYFRQANFSINSEISASN